MSYNSSPKETKNNNSYNQQGGLVTVPVHTRNAAASSPAPATRQEKAGTTKGASTSFISELTTGPLSLSPSLAKKLKNVKEIGEVDAFMAISIIPYLLCGNYKTNRLYMRTHMNAATGERHGIV